MKTLGTLALNVLIVLATAIAMEFVAYVTHKYVMHGFLWVLHQDHHQPTGRGLQKNDLFAVFFASISFLLVFNGLLRRVYPLASVGFGMMLYGIGYAVFHDLMFHRRIRSIRFRPKSGYLKRIINAHRVHHRHSEKEGGSSFGFLYAPKRYADEAS